MAIVHHAAEGVRQGRILVVDRRAAKSVSPFPSCSQKTEYTSWKPRMGRRRSELYGCDNPLMVDTILCDIRMPNVNGKEAIAYFRNVFPGGRSL